MQISEIAPILTGEKVTVTISAEKNGKLRVTYADRDGAKAVPFGFALRSDLGGGERLALL
jgi:hypothetical protein